MEIIEIEVYTPADFPPDCPGEEIDNGFYISIQGAGIGRKIPQAIRLLEDSLKALKAVQTSPEKASDILRNEIVYPIPERRAKIHMKE
jgi:hypothetical protein